MVAELDPKTPGWYRLRHIGQEMHTVIFCLDKNGQWFSVNVDRQIYPCSQSPGLQTGGVERLIEIKDGES